MYSPSCPRGGVLTRSPPTCSCGLCGQQQIQHNFANSDIWITSLSVWFRFCNSISVGQSGQDNAVCVCPSAPSSHTVFRKYYTGVYFVSLSLLLVKNILKQINDPHMSELPPASGFSRDRARELLLSREHGSGCQWQPLTLVLSYYREV